MFNQSPRKSAGKGDIAFEERTAENFLKLVNDVNVEIWEVQTR